MVTDVMLREATAEAERILLSHLPEDTGEKHVFSKRFESKMNKLLRRTAPPTRYRIARTVAAAAAVLLILGVNLGLLFKNVNLHPHPTEPTVTTPTDPTDPTEPSTAPTEPTTDPTEPSTAPTDPDATQPSVSEEVVVFVKEDEPTKLYCAPKNDLSQQRVIYESDFDAINDFVIEELGVYADKILTLTEGNKRVVMLDLTTGEATVVFECYYIEYAELVGLQEVDGKHYFTRVLFDGKPTENDRNSTYFFWTDSKTITEMPMQ